MTGVEITMLVLISINVLVIIAEMVSWAKYMRMLDRNKEVEEYLNSEQFQIDKKRRMEEAKRVIQKYNKNQMADRIDESLNMIDKIREQKDAELLCKTDKVRKSKPTPKSRNMLDNL